MEEEQTQQAQPQAPMITLNLDLNEVNFVIASLAEQPLKESIVVWDKVRMQTIQQLQGLQQGQPEQPAK